LNDAGYLAAPYPNDWKQLKNGELLVLAEREGYESLSRTTRT
jgi:hypothetical protein